MKNIRLEKLQYFSFLVLVLIILEPNTIYSQSLKISLGSGFQYHLEGTKSDGYIIPFVDRHSIATNSINEFFNNPWQLNFGVSYRFNKEIHPNLIIGMDFERSRLSSKFDEVNIILGKNLTMNMINPYVGFGKYLFGSNTINLIGSFGFSIMFSKGKAEKQNVKFTHNYKPSVFIRLGLGLEIELNQKFGVAFGAKGFLGNQLRDQVDVEYEGTATYLIPTGAVELQDNIISLYFCLQYRIEL